jgi:glutathione S-transferase
VYQLHITNKNYSSWSLRAWVLMQQLAIPFHERLHPLPVDGSDAYPRFRAFTPTGRVPCLHDGDTVVWDTLAITEYLAERHAGVWPAAGAARAWARCAAAEMHSGFGALRAGCSMSCGIRVRLHEVTPALARELGRLAELWAQGIARFGGPFLAGPAFTAVDAFFAPVAFRAQTYGLEFPGEDGAIAGAYAARLRELPAMRAWYEAALAETWREPGHEAEPVGTWLEDLRAR